MADRMLQQLMIAPRKIQFREVEKPKPGKGEVLVRMMRIGICGSDIHVWHGTHPFTSYPVTQGHEVSGIIEALGEDVNPAFRVGQKVTFEPQVTCGECYPCRHGRYNLCENLKVMGFQTTGAASEFFAVNQSRVDVLPDDMSLDEAAMIEPLAVAVHAVRKFGEIEGKNVVVLGAGPIGNLVAQTAKGLGAAGVMITCHGGVRMEKAKECGIEWVVDTGKVNLGQAIEEAFGQDKADVIYDCAGNDASMGDAIRYARKGSTIILVAVFGKPATVDLAVLNDHELDLNTTMMYRHDDYVTAIELVNQSRVKLQPLISNHFSFADYASAYKYIDENRAAAMKVIIDIP